VIVMDWGIALRLHDAAARSPSDAPGAPDAPDAQPSEAASPRDRTMTGMLLGTPAYMSPEQARGEHAAIDDRSDVYALCVMLHELLTLRHYLADRATLPACIDGVLAEEVLFPESSHPLQGPVPVELVHFVRHGVSKDPSGRYRSVTAMLDRLQRIEEGHCPVECTVTLMKRISTETSHAIDRRPYVVLAVALSVAMLLVGGMASIVGQLAP
jgi:serine/threonine protein kinase